MDAAMFYSSIHQTLHMDLRWMKILGIGFIPALEDAGQSGPTRPFFHMARWVDLSMNAATRQGNGAALI